MSNKSKRVVNQIKSNYCIKSIIPLIFVVAIVPIIVRMKIVDLPGARGQFNLSQDVNLDFFSYYKMVWLLAFTTIGVIIFSLKYLYKKDIHIKKTNIYIPMGIYTTFIILSTIFATHRDVALIGFMDRYENVYVLIAYMLCMFLAINLIGEEKQLKYLLFFLGLSSIVISAIGIFQFAKLDLFATEIGKKLIVPSEIAAKIESMKFSFTGTKRAYSTLFNPNYVGSYIGILFPLTCTILLLTKSKLSKLFFAIVSTLSLITLLASGSRAGIMGVGLYLVLLIIFFRTLIIKRWKSVLFLIVMVGLVAYGADQYLEGTLKTRVLAIKDSLTTVKDNDLEDIVLLGDRATIKFEDYEINIYPGNGSFEFQDVDGNAINTIREKNIIKFEEEPYNNHVFERYMYEDYSLLKVKILTKVRRLNFNLIVNDDNEFKFLSPQDEMVDLYQAPYWGFKGREDMASGRGYIWSRSIPMLKDTMILGHGPDTYGIHFPNDDYLGRLLTTGGINTLVDKPHNLYLQVGINTGVISLIAMLSIFFIYLKSSFQVYIKRKTYGDFFEIAGVGIFFAVCSYLMVSVLNDSVVSIAPVFWILLGTGMSINMKIKDQLE